MNSEFSEHSGGKLQTPQSWKEGQGFGLLVLTREGVGPGEGTGWLYPGESHA